jgi:hypothetical protein
MSLSIQIPPGSGFRQPLIRFSAAFNVPTIGFYDFNVAANTGVPLFTMRKNHLYLIDRYSFSADIPEADFFSAVNGGTVPSLQLRIPSQTNRQIYTDAIPLINYYDGLETLIAVFAEQEDDLQGTFRGALTQPAPLVGINTVTALFQPNIYEIKNKDWIDNFLGRTNNGQASGLLFPSRRP